MYCIIISSKVLIMVIYIVATGQEPKVDSSRKATPDQSANEVKLIMAFADPKNSFDDLLKHAKELRDSSAEEKTKGVLNRYIATLEAMALTKKDKENEKNEIKKLIYSLRDQRGFEYFTTDDPNSPASKLLAKGKEAVPFLIEELANDEFTRSAMRVSVNAKQHTSAMHVLRIGDCVCGILRKTTGEDFGGGSWYIFDETTATISPKEVKQKAKEWWEKQGKK